MKSRKRISALFLAAVMGMSLFGFGVTASAEYADLEGHWSAESVEKWSSAGIIQGEDGKFRPDDNITRAELAVLLDRLLIYSPAEGVQFPDVPERAWYADAITKLHAAGVMNGDENGAMRPEEFVSREETAALMYRALDVLPAIGELRFADASDVSDWAREAVSSLVSNQYIQGYANEFRPAAYMTRAEVVTLIDRMVALYANQPNTYSGSYGGIVVVTSDGVVLENLSAKGLLISSVIGSGTVVLNNTVIDGNVTKLNQSTKLQSTQSDISGSQPGGSSGIVSRPATSGGGGGKGGSSSVSTPTYRVMFKANGGTLGSANTLFVSVERGDCLGPDVPPEPTRANYVFTGWYLDNACTQKWDAVSSSVQKDMVVYAGWTEEVYYTVIFESNGGSAVASQRIFNGEKAKNAVPERKGYRFEGWYVNADFSGEAYSFDTAVTANITLYAKWSSETGQEILVLLADGVTGGSMIANPSAAIAGETVTLTFMPDAGKRLAGKPQIHYGGTQLAEADINALPDGTFTFVVPQGIQGDITIVPQFVTVYDITVPECEHGTAAADKAQAEAGETVTLGVIADDGYEVDSVTVTGDVTVNKVNDTTYTFVMPAENVTATVTFAAVKEDINTLELPLADNSFTQIGSSHVNAAKYTASSTELIFGKDRPSVFLKLDLSQVPENKSIVSARVKMTYKKRTEWKKGVVLLKDNGWTGTALTYNNSKEMFSNGTELVSPADYGTGDSEDLKTCSLDSARIPGLVSAMNQALKGDKLVSLAIHYDNNQGQTKSDATNFYSKDYNVEADCPVVILELTDRVTEEYDVTVQESEHGTVTADKTKAEAGETVAVTAIPSEGYEVEEVTVIGGATATKVNDTTYTFIMPAENVTVAVRFKKTAEPEPEKYTVSKQAAENGGFDVDKTTAQKDETVTITVAPSEGYEVEEVIVTGGVTVTKVNDTTYTFVMPAEGVTVAVSFKAIVVSGIEKTVTLGADRYGYAVNTASGGDDRGWITMITKQNATDFTSFTKGSDIMRMGLLGFDLSQIKEDGGTIQSAKLILTPRTLKNANTVFVHSFDKHNWGPVTTGKQVFELYATDGVFTIPEKFATMDGLEVNTAKELDITELCQQNSGEKISFLFTSDTSETANTELQWYSPLSSVAEDRRPRLVVTYVTLNADAEYNITVQESENGSVSVDKTQAKEDETVTITSEPAEGYEVDSVVVSKAEGTVATQKENNTAYTFIMPAENVTVTVTFKKISVPAETETLELPLADNSFTQIGSSHVNAAKYTASSTELIFGKDRPSVFLKLDLSQVPANKRIVSACVKMTYKKRTEWNKGVVLLKDNSWTGTALTYNNSKEMFSNGTELISPADYSTGDSEDLTTCSLDSARIPGLVDAMNQALTGDGLISLAIHYDNNQGKTKSDATNFYSKDYSVAEQCPVVILEIADK